jgi:hypothetical protein
MIYIVKHKEYNNPVPKGYKEIGVGDLFVDKPKGEDIEYLNPHINEATAYYDLWKNSKDKTIGVCHYRRFFAENGQPISTHRVNAILNDYEMIVAPKYKYTNSLCRVLRADLAPGLEQVLLSKYMAKIYMREPKFHEYMVRNNEFYPREMIIAKREIFDKFCEELFATIKPIAEEYREEYMNDAEVAKKNPRIIGFITERFFSYLIVKNSYKVYEMEILDI